MTAVAAGQVYDWLGAEVLVDEVAEDGSGARITIRQDGCRPRQKWQPLPFPDAAVLITRPMTACCDLHGRNCEPPSELCCARCTEAVHRIGDAITGVHAADGSACSNPDLSSAGAVQAAAAEIASLP